MVVVVQAVNLYYAIPHVKNKPKPVKTYTQVGYQNFGKNIESGLYVSGNFNRLLCNKPLTANWAM